MAEIAWTSEALRWLEDIFEYIAADNPDAAAETVEGIYQRAQVLAQYPEIGHRFIRSERNVRILSHGNYRIAYLITRDGNVDILGVFHSALDITKYQL
jgi:toxin ParE1/3/4